MRSPWLHDPGVVLYGVAGSSTKTGEFCAQHKKEGMVNVRKHKCNHPTCTTSPLFGVAGTRKAEFCAPHAKEGMVPVSGKKCSGADCTKQLVYGLMGTTKAIVCVQHREGGLGNVVSKRCGSQENQDGFLWPCRRCNRVVPAAHRDGRRAW